MKYTVQLKRIEYLYAEVEADSFDDAQDIAEDTDYDDYTYVDGECFVSSITDEHGKTAIVGI